MSFELDEIIPFSFGGSAVDYNNVQPTHRICNQAKSNKIGFNIRDDEPRNTKDTETKNITDW